MCDDGDGVDGVGSVVGGVSRIVCRVFFVSSDLGALWGVCPGLLSDLPQKSVEPIALQCGSPVRTLPRFLRSSIWDHERTCPGHDRTCLASRKTRLASERSTFARIPESFAHATVRFAHAPVTFARTKVSFAHIPVMFAHVPDDFAPLTENFARTKQVFAHPPSTFAMVLNSGSQYL